jgi:nitrite reductase/ring-hydroxylating ferredoxin subunit
MPEHQVIPAFDESKLPHVGTYRRVLPVSLTRMYENALDWEHLPYVHASSFSAIRMLDSGAWGWRAELVNAQGAESVIELRLDRACRRWITRTLAGPNAGSEIWTHAFPIGDSRVDIVVDFFVPDVAPHSRNKVGHAFAALYQRLYDEDVAMMVERQRQLDRRVETAGSTDELRLGQRQALALPLACEIGGRGYVVAEVDGEVCAYPAQCPHQLGPLAEAPLEDGVVRCPWHGYGFDVSISSCLRDPKWWSAAARWC